MHPIQINTYERMLHIRICVFKVSECYNTHVMRK
jgi:hypothetical protein